MREWQSLSHVKWECKYHVVIVPKYRKKVLFGRLRGDVGKVIRQLCRQKEVELIEGHAMPDHVHMVLSVPPKYSIAMVVGYLKGNQQSISTESFTVSIEVSPANTFGPEGTVSVLSAWIKKWSEPT